jgi:UDP-GlcNAc:undecaprenyl-phosphate GlcNAc-1-phosphate transferase
MATYLIVYGVAAALSLVATPAVIRLAVRIGAVDQPGPRKVHTVPIPRIGGLVILFALAGSVLMAVALDGTIRQEVGRNLTQFLGLLSAASLVLAVGLVDDIRGLRAQHKLVAEIAAAAALCALGVRIESLGAKGLFQIQFGWLSWPLTILWIVGITNSVNLIDGLDGLAAGISAIACATVLAFALQAHQAVMAVLMLAMLGGLTAFLVYNFNPARIFLGDCGSLFLGFMLAGASVFSSTKTATAVGLALPLLAMGIPVFDTLLAMLRRALARRSLFAPDRRHIHHHLTALGLRQRHAVFLLYGATAVSAGLGMFMMIAGGAGALIIFLCLLLLLGIFLRAAGAFRLDGATGAVRGILRLARAAKKDRQICERAQLRLWEVHSMGAWWRVIAETAEKMGAVRLAITRPGARGAKRTVLCRQGPQPAGAAEAVWLTLAIRDGRPGSEFQAEMDLRAEGSLEVLGRRLALFGRLIDENAGPDLRPQGQREENARTPQRRAA